MKRIKALEDINRSARSIGAPGTTIIGFCARLQRQYGAKATLWAVEHSKLEPLHAGWVKRWLEDNEV